MQRRTKQRSEIIEMLTATPQFCSAQDLHALLKQNGSTIGLATVYRNLETLASAGEVNTIRSEEGETLYRLCEDEHHHHHLVCRNCGAIQQIDAEELDQWVENVAATHGFTNVSHLGDLFGLCPECSTN